MYRIYTGKMVKYYGLATRTRAGRALLSWGIGQSQEGVRRLHPCGFHAVSRQPSPEQLLAAALPWCTPLSRLCILSNALPPTAGTSFRFAEAGGGFDAEVGVRYLGETQEPEILGVLGFLSFLGVL